MAVDTFHHPQLHHFVPLLNKTQTQNLGVYTHMNVAKFLWAYRT